MLTQTLGRENTVTLISAQYLPKALLQGTVLRGLHAISDLPVIPLDILNPRVWQGAGRDLY